jgi:Tol biopolymer transport system component
MRTDGSQPSRVTNSKTIELDPTWSPDGARIAFTVLSNPEQDQSDIYVMNADGSGRKALTQGLGLCYSPSWSPDGKRLAFSCGHEQEARLRVVDAAGGSHQEFGQGFRPSWSPSGREILFTREPVPPPNNGFWPYRLFLTSAPAPVEARPSSSDKPLPRAQVVLAVREVPPPSSVDSSWNAGGGVWSPDGKLIAFVTTSSRSLDMGICIMKSDGTQVRQLTHSSQGKTVDFGPVWSPNGKSLFFNRNIYTDQGVRFDIFAVDADGKNLRRVRETGGLNLVGNDFLTALAMFRHPPAE